MQFDDSKAYIINSRDALEMWRSGKKEVERNRFLNPKMGEAYDLAVEVALPELAEVTNMGDLRTAYDLSHVSLTPALESAEERYDLILNITVLEDYLFFTKGSQLIQAWVERRERGDDPPKREGPGRPRKDRP